MPLERRTSDAKFRVYLGEEDSDNDNEKIKHNHVEAKFSLKEFDPITFNVLKVDAETLAGQLTLIDLPLFKAIQPDELTSCSWNKKDKLTVAPNVVAFTRRWNHVCLWCQKEILATQKTKLRAEVVAHFIKIAKKLVDLNNLHSARAIMSGLQSTPIHRLDKTWALVGTKGKSSLENTAKLFVENENYKNLRHFIDHAKLPCIPYLGLYLTDLIYIDVAHPSSGGIDSTQRTLQMNNHLKILADFQQSNYDNLTPIDCVQCYLKSVHYIDELQKFVEEDFYQKSLELEPQELEPLQRRDSLPISVISKRSFNLSIAPECSIKLKNNSNSLAVREASQFIPSHRKSHSLGNYAAMAKYTNESFWNDDGSSLSNRVNFIDDSLIELDSSLKNVSSASSYTQPSDFGDDSGHETCDEKIRGGLVASAEQLVAAAVAGYELDGCDMQGAVRRKTVLKEGKRPTMAPWTRYWLMLYGTNLFYFPTRSISRNYNTRNAYKMKPCKVQCVSGWMTVLNQDPQNPGGFQLQEPSLGHVYRFRSGSQLMAMQWFEKLEEAANRNKTKIPANLMSFEDVP